MRGDGGRAQPTVGGTTPSQVVLKSISKLRRQWEVSHCFSVISASIAAFMVFLEFLSWLLRVIDSNQFPKECVGIGRGGEEREDLNVHLHSDTLPLIRPHLLIAPLSLGQAFKHMSLKGPYLFKPPRNVNWEDDVNFY